ncbi:MAG TPA: hypothetical protein VFL17_14760 [Anaerolineae bacterium]|nr:hypothetical protein [Anaerolineae bacterium]
MSKFLKFAGMVTLVAAMVIALGAIWPASAQTAMLAAPAARLAHGGGFSRGMCGEAGLEAAAEALGMTTDELSTQLWGGKTLADLADEAGVELQAVRDAVEAACEQAIRDAIEQAVTDGQLTREHADWLLEGLDNGYWGSGSGFGFGGHGFGPGGFRGGGFHGFRGGMGFHGFGFPNSNSVTPDSSGL